MHTIQLKNKRGKVVATLQWERPEDLINWATANGEQNGLELRNVDPEAPITLMSEAPPVHKLKIIAKESKVLKTHSDVQTLLMSVSENLHEEFEILMCKSFVNEKSLADKKNQINALDEITEALFDLQQLQEKTEMCLMNYGVSHDEYRDFIKQPMDYIINLLTEMRETRSVQLPDVFCMVLDYKVKEKHPLNTPQEPRTVDKPVYGMTKLLEMKNQGIKFKGTWSLTDAKKEIDDAIEKFKRRGDDLCTGT